MEAIDPQTISSLILRHLTEPDNINHRSRGRTILTILYLCVLSLCFITPIFYYCRLQCEDRQNRRLRDLEIAGIRSAMQRSEAQMEEENRAACKKFNEERRARIIQLFSQVRMVSEENQASALSALLGE